jgi:hypothetical protein
MMIVPSLKNKQVRFLLWAIMSLHCVVGQAQSFTLTGKVLDKAGAGIPFANIYMKSTMLGASTDDNGQFSFNVSKLPDSLIVTELGFKPYIKYITTPSTDALTIQLEDNTLTLQEVEVMGYRDPGKSLMKKVIAHRADNDPNRLQNYTRQEYEKMEIDIVNGGAMQHKFFIGNIASAYQKFNTDTTQKENIPVFFRENMFLNYHAGGSQLHVRQLEAVRKMGFATDELERMLSKFDVIFNIYDGGLTILKTPFTAPVSAAGLVFNHYDITDTIKTTTPYTYIVKFSPKTSHENTFSGTLWIEAETYAIKKVDMTSDDGLNMNFVQKLSFQQEYASISDPTNTYKMWVLKRNESTMKVPLGWELMGVDMKYDSTKQQVVIHNTNVFDDYKTEMKGITAKNFNTLYPKWAQKDTAYVAYLTETDRIEPLSRRENVIYQVVDSLHRDPHFQTSSKVVATFATGYFDVGKNIRLGPIYSILSSNQQEGLRSRVSLWTLPNVSKNWNFNGYAAYGFGDKKWKGGAGIKYAPPTTGLYRKTEFQVSSDYNALRHVGDEIDDDNLATLAFTKNAPSFKIFTQQASLAHERELNRDWTATVSYTYKHIKPTFDFVNLSEDATPNTPSVNTLKTSEIGLNFRYAHNERTVILNYDKLRYNATPYPIINLNYIYGTEMGVNTNSDYHKFEVNIAQNINIAPKGVFHYSLSAGQIIGTVPYLALYSPPGNSTFVMNKYSFNNMLPFEFAADRYASLLMRYSMGGFILNKIPLLNKLHLRERITSNFYWGNMNAANTALNKDNNIHTTGATPYAEAGVGIENIFNVFSIDAIWRLNHLNNSPNTTRFGIYTGFRVNF